MNDESNLDRYLKCYSVVAKQSLKKKDISCSMPSKSPSNIEKVISLSLFSRHAACNRPFQS